MPKQDRTGTKYEKLLAFSLEILGFARNTDGIKNYLQPPKNSEVVIAGTFIQPDLVVRNGEQIASVVYSTHWSNTRSSKYKFWRTWEEQAQQRVAVGDTFLAVNCVFEVLPTGSKPMICTTAEDLPFDASREGKRPIQLEGWDPGIGWALLESFDVSILFPKGYGPISDVSAYEDGDHDSVTTALLRKALSQAPKSSFSTQWKTLRSIKSLAPPVPRTIPVTASRYRIGLLHVYLLCRVLEARVSGGVSVEEVVDSLLQIAGSDTDITKLRRKPPFDKFSADDLDELVATLATVYVRRGSKPETFCTIREFSNGKTVLRKIAFNKDLRLCVDDLKSHVKSKGFVTAIESAFKRFDRAFGVAEAIADLAFPDSAENKTGFVERTLLPLSRKPKELGDKLWKLSHATSSSRKAISAHIQNWHFEILLNLCGLNSTEDIQTRFKERFERSGHKLRPHAPYGGHAQTVAFMLQGRDLCELWSGTVGKRTLTPDAFRELCWFTVAACIADALADRGSGHKSSTAGQATIQYLQSKSMRIISSDLNGFYIMIEHFLGDVCHLQFLGEDEQEDNAAEALSIRVCPSWQTDMVNKLWGGAPLETWVEGVSKDGEWLVKVQSSQDGNEGHKTKELAGRCRAMHLEWKPGKDPAERSKWTFKARTMPKCALVLDGDWDRIKKKNLYEAGWDWVGDVSQLSDLRKLIRHAN
jgi:hypothetical protein